MKIRNVFLNSKKQCFEIEVGKKRLSLPLALLSTKPSRSNPIQRVFVDPELGNQAITYLLKSGVEDSIHIDVFLHYNRDPGYLKTQLLYQLTSEVLARLSEIKVSKHELIRRLETSPSQLYRLLDPTNSKKSVDEMLRLLAVLGCDVELQVRPSVA